MPARYHRHKYLMLFAIGYLFFTIAATPAQMYSIHSNSTDTLSPARKKPKSTANVATPEEEVLTFVEVYPCFPGGENSLHAYLRKNIRQPEAAAKAGINGDILVKFYVDKSGILKDIHVASPPKGYGLEEEALRVVTNMPKWKPANNGGRLISVYDSLLIHFDTSKNQHP